MYSIIIFSNIMHRRLRSSDECEAVVKLPSHVMIISMLLF